MLQPTVCDAVIAVVIVNFRTPDLVVNCIESLASERKQFSRLSVVVVDNDSQDNSLDILNRFVQAKNLSSWVEILPAPKNGGYAYGNNLGFDKAKSWLGNIDYFWMLNPDTRVLPNATLNLIQFLIEHPASIVGSRLQDEDGTKQVSAFNFPSIISEMCSGFGLGILDTLFKKHIVCLPVTETASRCDWLAGASLMFTAETQKRLGSLDENYFLYFEEVDYLFLAQSSGIFCWYIPESKVIHEVGASTGISDVRKQQPRRPAYWFESRRRYFLKNHNRVTLMAADLLWMLGYSTWVVRSLLLDRERFKARVPCLLSDFFIQSQFNPVNWFK